MTFHDLASLAKPLVTATLAHAFLDLDADRRWVLGFHDRTGPLTARMLLSHASGLPAWRPFTSEPLSAQLRRPVDEAAHPLLSRRPVGEAYYSDLNYRLLGELLEMDLGLPWTQLGEAMGLTPAPWRDAPAALPPGPDREAWAFAADAPFPDPEPALPHDANARAGMIGHAGFGATAAQLEAFLARWVAAGWPSRMAVDLSKTADGTIWGLGLQRVMTGSGRFSALLEALPEADFLVRVVEDATDAAPAPAPRLEGPPGPPSSWWMHAGFTGPAIFFRPTDGACLALLCHRRGPDGALLDLEAMRARRWAVLEGLRARLGG